MCLSCLNKMGRRVVSFLKTLNLIYKNQNSLLLHIYFTFNLLFLVTVFFLFFSWQYIFLFFNEQALNAFVKNRCSCISKRYKYDWRFGWGHRRIAIEGRLFLVKLQAYSLLLHWQMRSIWGVFKDFIWILGAFFFYFFFPEQLVSSCHHCFFLFYCFFVVFFTIMLLKL